MQLGERFDRALAFASALHRGQVRKSGGVPYVSHLLAVAAIAIEHGASEDEAIGALLHDAIEDRSAVFGGATKLRAAIREQYGDAVLAIVEGCTDADTEPKPPWRARKEAFVARMATAPRPVLFVCCADKLHNARSIASELRASGERTWDTFNGGKQGTLWYYRSLWDVFDRRLGGRIAGDYGRAIAEMQALAQVAGRGG